MVDFTGERIVPEADNCEPQFAKKMYLEHLTRYRFASQWIKGKRVLDVGCGVGYGSRWMAENGAESVRAFDISADAIAHAKEFYAHEKVEFEVGSATDFAFDQRFDVIACFELIEHVDDQSAVIECIRDALDPNGILVISTPRALEQKRTHFHTREFSEREFLALLRLGFPNVQLFFQNNHLTSLIAGGPPQSVGQVLTLDDQFSLASADYFIAVASPSVNRALADDCGPVMLIGDDKYIRLLERDVGILHDAEDRLKVEVGSLGGQLSKRTRELANLQAEFAQSREALTRCELLLSDRERELEQLRSDIVEKRETIAAREAVLGERERNLLEIRDSLERERQMVHERAEQLATREGELDRIRAEAAGANDALLDREARLLEYREELERTRAEAAITAEALSAREASFAECHQALDHARSRIADLGEASRNELSECNKRLAEKEQELERQRDTSIYLDQSIKALKASRSWRITAPYRWLGHMVRRFRRPRAAVPEARRFGESQGARVSAGPVKQPASGTAVAAAHILGIPVGDVASAHAFDVVYAIGCWEGESKRYRVHNLAKELEKQGLNVRVMPFEHIATLCDEEISARAVVLFRAPFDPSTRVDLFLDYAKRKGIKVVFDVDDAVFEPDIIDQIDGFRLLPEVDQERYIRGVHQYRKLLLAADLVTVPTEYLRARAAHLGKPVSVIPNSINDVQQNIANELLAQPRVLGEVVRIGYFSGSHTHQADFAQCADALFEVMREHPSVVFRVVGYLDLESRWDEFAERIERIEFLSYQDMLRVLHECDINIAPLDLESIFCHGKSELKYFEAGLVGVPTVASATDTYTRAIEHEVDGFVLKSMPEWKGVLTRLVTSPELRQEVGMKARASSLARYSARAVARIARRVYELDQSPPSRGATQGHGRDGSTERSSMSLRISWVIPELIIGGGGHRNILRAAYYLAQFGHRVSLYFTGNERRPEAIKDQIREHFYPLDCPVYAFDGSICPSDVVFATHWTTVEAALSARGHAREIMYFVQDFEPAFAPMGSEYVLAENTYRLGLYHITSGPWCETILRRDFHADADHFQFPVDRSIYYPRERRKENKNLIFFAKPEMSRRCFELGVFALREFHRIRPDVEIILFGSRHASKYSYDFPVTIRDVLPTLEDLAQMYSNGDVGLVFSTTNPSLIPYEMMACGLPVVDLNRGDNAVNYGGRRDIALLANPLPVRMAEQIAALIGNADELANRRDRGLVFVDGFPSEEEMARRIESLIFSRLMPKEEERT